jgi:hypothetical protein
VVATLGRTVNSISSASHQSSRVRLRGRRFCVFEPPFSIHDPGGPEYALRMAEPEIWHTTSAQPTRIIRFHLRMRERPTVGMSGGIGSHNPTSGQRRRNSPEENVNFRSARKGVPRSHQWQRGSRCFSIGGANRLWLTAKRQRQSRFIRQGSFSAGIKR